MSARGCVRLRPFWIWETVEEPLNEESSLSIRLVFAASRREFFSDPSGCGPIACWLRCSLVALRSGSSPTFAHRASLAVKMTRSFSRHAFSTVAWDQTRRNSRPQADVKGGDGDAGKQSESDAVEQQRVDGVEV